MPFSDYADDIWDNFPLLDTLKGWMEGNWASDGVSFRHTMVLFVQHQLGDTFSQVPFLMQPPFHLSPSRVHWMCIPYTTSELFCKRLTDLGVPEPNVHREGTYTLSHDYPPFMLKRTWLCLQQLNEQAKAAAPGELAHLVVVDDGAYVLEALAAHPDWETTLPHLAQLSIALVEQTARGIFKMQDNPSMARLTHRWPVVSVAGSAPKKEVEPKYIGQAISNMVSVGIAEFGVKTRQDGCLLLGFGAIGEATAEMLRAQLDQDAIHVWDPDQSRMDHAKRLGYPLWDRHGSPRPLFRFVFGCAGRPSFTPRDVDWLADGALLLSASSGTVELSLHDFIGLAVRGTTTALREGVAMTMALADPGALEHPAIHRSVTFRITSRHQQDDGQGSIRTWQISFANGGIPVTFCGHLNPTEPEKFQSTSAMMSGGAVQARRCLNGPLRTLKGSADGDESDESGQVVSPKLVALDRCMCEMIIREFRALEAVYGW